MSKFNKLILICVETNKKSKTDDAYIDKALKHLYYIKNDEKLAYIYLETKTKFNDRGIQKQIKDKVCGEKNYVVIFCLDLDDASTNPETSLLNERIEKFCKDNNYQLVWFCESVEEVFLHKQVDKSQKIITAKKFGRDKGIGQATEQSLSQQKLNKTKSNFMLVFNEIFERS